MKVNKHDLNSHDQYYNTIINNKYNDTQIHLHTYTYSPNFTNGINHQRVTNVIIHQAQKQIWHLSSYAMRLDTNLYACGTDHRQGCHLKNHILIRNCIINIASGHLWMHEHMKQQCIRSYNNSPT